MPLQVNSSYLVRLARALGTLISSQDAFVNVVNLLCLVLVTLTSIVVECN